MSSLELAALAPALHKPKYLVVVYRFKHERRLLDPFSFRPF